MKLEIIAAGNQIFVYEYDPTIPNCLRFPVSDLCPRWIPVIDVRVGKRDALSVEVRPGIRLIGAERAEWAMGLRTSIGYQGSFALPVFATRSDHDLDIQKHLLPAFIARLVEQAERLRLDYLKGNGYLPVLITVSNFGGSVYVDQRVHRAG